jgi:hypothetical protein
MRDASQCRAAFRADFVVVEARGFGGKRVRGETIWGEKRGGLVA